MKRIFYFLMIVFTVHLSAQDIKYSKISINGLKESDLFIKGTTNVSTFTCLFDTAYLKECQEVLYTRNTGEFNFKKAILVLDTRGFDCGSQAINRDFHKLLQTDVYPQITIEVKKAEINSAVPCATVLIGIASKVLEYKTPITITESEEMHFEGVLKLKLSDYELKLPKKLFGLIEVGDEIEIHFDITAQHKELY